MDNKALRSKNSDSPLFLLKLGNIPVSNITGHSIKCDGLIKMILISYHLDDDDLTEKTFALGFHTEERLDTALDELAHFFPDKFKAPIPD